MTPQPVLARADLLAALQLQYDWGVDEVIEEQALDRLVASPPDLHPLRASARTEAVFQPEEQEAVSQEVNVLAGLGMVEDAPDLETLVRITASPPDLFLARTATHRLEPVFVENAPFMLIGETPDADEDRSGVLFAGDAGDLLDRMLKSVGLDRACLSMAPAIPWRPPGGRSPTIQEMNACHPLLLRTVALCRPRCLVTMGVTPLRMLVGPDAQLGRMRGRWTHASVPGLAEPIRLLPMRHPLQLRASPAARRNAWQDLLILTEEYAP